MPRRCLSPFVLLLPCLGCHADPVDASVCPEPAPVTAGRDEATPSIALDKASFLPLLEDRALRDQLWVLYVAIEPVAMRFAGAPEDWTPVRLLIGSDRALWWDHGLVEIPVAADDGGAIAHELFHGSFHRSPLNAGRDAAWGEGFADAFRYFLERDLMGNEASPWMLEMDRLAQLEPEALAELRRNDELVRVYSYPALVILDRVDRDFGRFEALWFEIGERRRAAGHDILAEEFGDLL